MQIPYDFIVERAYHLINMIGLCKTLCADYLLRDELCCYLEACGWTDLSFDEETLRRIDQSWEVIMN